MGTALLRDGREAPARLLAAARRLSREEAQGLVEYGLILALMALVAVVALTFFGGELSTLLSVVGGAASAG